MTALPTTPHALHVLVLAVALAAVWALAGPGRRAVVGLGASARRELVAIALVGLLSRLVLSRRGLLIGPDAGFERVVLAWGQQLDHPVYGGGFAALFGLLQPLTGWHPDTLFRANLGLSAAAVPLLWAIARGVAPDRPLVARLAGVGLATLPVALKLAGSEVMQVSVATLELAAVAAVVGAQRVETPRPSAAGLAVAAALFGGLAVHVRPEAALFPLALGALGLLAAPGRRAVAAGAAVGAALLAAPHFIDGAPGAGVVRFSQLLHPGFWLDALWPRLWWSDPGMGAVVVDARVTPLLVPVLAVCGVALGPRRPAAVGVVWWLATTAAVLPKAFPDVDALRLQLAGLAPALVLMGLGAAALLDRYADRPRVAALARPWALPALLALLVAPRIPWVLQRWATSWEWSLMRGLDVAPGEIVRFADHTSHGEAVGRVGAWLAPGTRWLGLGEGGDPSGQLAWVGVACRARDREGSRALVDHRPGRCRELLDRCTLTAVHVAQVPPRTDVDISLGDAPVELGLYRVSDCAGWPPPEGRRRRRR